MSTKDIIVVSVFILGSCFFFIKGVELISKQPSTRVHVQSYILSDKT